MNQSLLVMGVAAALGLSLALVFRLRRRSGGSFGIALPGRRSRPRLCPHLGLAADPFKHYPSANNEHRCYANLGRERIDLAHQRRFCLASCYDRCPFLTVQKAGLLERIWAWGRAVSPAPQARVGVPRRPHGRSPWGSPRAIAAAAVPVARAFGARAWALLQESVSCWQRIIVRLASRLAIARLPHPRVRTTVQPTQHAPTRVVEPAVVEVTSAPAPEMAGMAAAPALRVAEAATSVAQPMWRPAEVVEQAPLLAEEDLVESGISALEAGDEAAAYTLFKRATKSDPQDLRAWFWRAKTAESLDEVITCLEKAHALEPANTQIKANLDSALQRREQARASKGGSRATSNQARSEALAAPWRRHAPRRIAYLGSSVCELMRMLTAVAAFGVGAAWLLSALPAELRQTVTAAGGLSMLPVPDAATVFARLPVSLPVVEGYRTASALPYGLGFLVEFVGLGLLSGDRWTRAWAPLVGLGSAWLWLHAADPVASPLVLAACVLTASGGVLVQRGRTARPPGQQQATFA